MVEQWKTEETWLVALHLKDDMLMQYIESCTKPESPSEIENLVYEWSQSWELHGLIASIVQDALSKVDYDELYECILDNLEEHENYAVQNS